MGLTERKLFREVLSQTGNPVLAIRAVREVFGLSLAEAKEVWLQAIGRAGSLTESEEKLADAPLLAVCPRCRKDADVVRKLHTLPKHYAYDGSKPVESPGRDFVNGFWCTSCQIGFVPEHLLKTFGIQGFR